MAKWDDLVDFEVHPVITSKKAAEKDRPATIAPIEQRANTGDSIRPLVIRRNVHSDRRQSANWDQNVAKFRIGVIREWLRSTQSEFLVPIPADCRAAT